MDPARLIGRATTLLIPIGLAVSRADAQGSVLERPADSARVPLRESRLEGWPDPVPDGFTRLPLDALIDLLPPAIRAERTRDGGRELHPLEFEFQRRVFSGTELTTAQWFRVLSRTNKLRYRTRWPAGEPFKLELWNPVIDSRYVRLAPRIEGWRSVRFPLWDLDLLGGCGMDSAEQQGGLAQLQQTDRSLSLGSHFIQCGLEVARTSGEIALPVEIVARLDDAMPPVSGAAIDAAVRASFGVAFQPADPTLGHAVLRCEAALDVDPALAHIAVCADIERLCDGVAVGYARHVCLPEIDVRMRAARGGTSSRAEMFALELERIPAACLRDERERARWSLRVTSTTNDVLTQWWCDRYWKGSFELPLAEAMEREAKRRGPAARAPAGPR